MVADAASNVVLHEPEILEKVSVRPGHPVQEARKEVVPTTGDEVESQGFGGAHRVCASEGQGGSGGQGRGLEEQLSSGEAQWPRGLCKC